MAEVSGLVLGAVSLLAGFKGAVDGFVLISDLFTAFDGSSYLLVKLKVENERLRIWGDLYGCNDQDNCARLQRESANTQSLILYILTEMKMITTDVSRLKGKYGMELVNVDTENDPKLYQQAKADSLVVRNLAAEQIQLDKNSHKDFRLPSGKRLQWIVRDAAKFEKLLDRLEYLNDSLERVLPRHDAELLALGLSSYILPSNNSVNLLSTLQSSPQHLLSACATMKSIKLSRTIVAKVPNVDTSTLHSFISLVSVDTERTLAIYTRPENKVQDTVLIEWKPINRKLSPSDADQVLSRVKNLCTLLSQPQPTQFRLLSCIGLTTDEAYAAQHDGHKRLGLVFAYPASAADRPVSLRDVLVEAATTQDREKKMAPLGERFCLAQALVGAMLLLHSSRWLHKNMRSENVLFFCAKKDLLAHRVPIEDPYIAGFEFSRPDLTGEPSLERPDPKPGKDGKEEVDVYRHPGWRQGFSRLSDIYSLGVLLFEIGLWKSVEKYRDVSEEATRAKLIHNTRILLPGVMGESYSLVVLRCLTGDFGLGSSTARSEELDKAFWNKVVKELEGCRA